MTPMQRIRRSSPMRLSIVSNYKTLPLRTPELLHYLVETLSNQARSRSQQLLYSTFVDRNRKALIIPTTIMGPLESCVPMLTMAAAREDPQQDAHGTPCMPKPRRQLSLRLIMTTLSALDIYPPTRYRRLGSAYSSKSRNPASAPSRIQKSGLGSR